jgi:hypothetical protein
MKYTQILREKFQDKIDAIPNAKKERVLSKVSKYIAMVEEKNV